MICTTDKLALGLADSLLLDLNLYGLKQYNITIYGKTHPFPRSMSWFGKVHYTFSGITLKQDVKPTEPLRTLLGFVQDTYSSNLNCCLLNYYKNGSDYINWHSDDEFIFDSKEPIVTVSVGGSRRFKVRSILNHSDVVEYDSGHGDIIVMLPGFQQTHQHSIPKTSKQVDPRLSFTFRSYKA